MSLRIPKKFKLPTVSEATDAGIRFFKLRLLRDGRYWKLVPQSALDYDYAGGDVVAYFEYAGTTPESAYNNFLKALRSELEAQIRHQGKRS